MAHLATRPRQKVRTDDLFFFGMALLSLIVVFVGFARTYFLAGVFRAPLPNVLIHIHGAVYTLCARYPGQVHSTRPRMANLRFRGYTATEI